MIIDCHVHACATTPGHGSISDTLLHSVTYRLLRWLLGIKSAGGEAMEREAEAKLVETVNGAAALDRVVVLAFDAVYDDEGKRDDANTHLYVTNDYAAELARKYPKLLFGASVHPNRRDALAELERCIAQGAVLLKWLPIVQNFNPADERCLPLYEALAHHKLPLLCHTGGERALPNLNRDYADPALLIPALNRGVTVIAAHCGTRARLGETDYVPTFARMAHEYEKLYGDTALLNFPSRSYAYDTIFNDAVVRQKVVHGSDWPLPPIPPRRIGWLRAARLLAEKNWLLRDVRIKECLGFDAAFWQRTGSLLHR
jgi:predicted TIM-barrel fold metal-dependent hydrolase